MEVTRKNFREALPAVEKAIEQCVFLAIDTEFTGLSSGLEKSESAMDTPAEYYQKFRNGSSNFLMVQFGLVAFMYNNEEKKYTYQAFNFYVFPKPFSRQAPDCRFMCQASSIDFLASHGFDFNKLFCEGIPYLNKNDEHVVRIKLQEARERRKSLGDQNSSFVECPPEHEKAVKDAVKSIDDFLSAKNKSNSLSLPSLGGFIRKLVYQEVWKKYSTNDLRIETKNNVMVVKHPATENEKEDEEEAEIEDAVGFSNVIRLISQSRKLVVGHFMFGDLCHIINHFCVPLPESYLEFKEILHSVFPHVLDTKFMCASRPLKDQITSSVLGHVLSNVTLNSSQFHVPKITSVDRNAYSVTDRKEHEAGYDAFITGHVAIGLSNYLVRDKKIKPVPVPRLPSATSTHLSDYINRLYLMRVTNTTDCYIDLERDDPEPNRDAVFHVTFPEEWKTSDLHNMFSPFGGVDVSWINSQSAFCSLVDKSQVVSVKQKLVPTTPAGVTVMTYYAFTSLPQPSPVRVRRRSMESDKPPVLKRKLSSSQESLLKRPSVESIPEEPEEKEKTEQMEQQPRKKQKVENGTKPPVQDAAEKLFEESSEW